MALTLVPKYTRALAEQLNAFVRVLRGTDPDSIDLRLNGGGHFAVRHSGTNAVILEVTDAGVAGIIQGADIVDGSVGTAELGALCVTNTKLGPDAVTSDKIAPNTIVDADVSPTAAVAVTKVAHVGANNVLKSTGTANVGGQVVNADVSASAAIAYSKLALGSSITSADLVDGTIVNADVNAAAALALSKLAPGASGVLKSNGTAISAGNAIVTGDMVINTINGDRIADATMPGAKILGGAPPAAGTGAPDAYKVYATAAAGTTVSLQQLLGDHVAVPSGVSAAGASGQLFLAATASLDSYSAGGTLSGDLPGLTFALTTTATDWMLLGLAGAVGDTTGSVFIGLSLLQGATTRGTLTYSGWPAAAQHPCSLWEAFNPGAGTFTYKATYSVNASQFQVNHLRFVGIVFRR